VFETGSDLRSAGVEQGGTQRLLWASLRRNEGDQSDVFVLAYAVKSATHREDHARDQRTRHHSTKSVPFLRRWQGVMNLWASRNCEVLTAPLTRRVGEFNGLSASSSVRGFVIAPPDSPARPACSTSVLQALECPRSPRAASFFP
jgi:hypothetical protein